MKIFYFMFFALILLYGCNKENGERDEYTRETYQLEYIDDEKYTQTFYYSGGLGYISPDGVHNGSYYKSICNRVHFQLYDYDSTFNTINPPQKLREELEELNNNAKDKKLKYYLVAKIQFQYQHGYATNVSLKSEWEIIIGKMDEYIFERKIYECLIIMEY